MNIEIKPTKGKDHLVSWLLISLISLVSVFVIHLLIYAVFYYGKVSFIEQLTGTPIIFYFYAIIFPGAIVHSYKPVCLEVEHLGEVNPMLIKEYFLQRGYVELADGNGFFKVVAQKWFDRLFKGSKQIVVNYTKTNVEIILPANKLYEVHHGFKFQEIFVR
ncbi:MAG: hypothetical protein PHE03_07375 [Bacteroidales bacterium]|nr:hypothetical protein [Bacteroidales bacterium]MDD3892108.1 hypothetical protein [Bacteroidales bacterium]